MATILRVSIDKTGAIWVLDVEDSCNANRFDANNIKRKIRWELDGNAAGGAFHLLAEPDPGFKWLEPLAPPGVFGKPELSDDRKQISVTNLHKNSGSSGTFIYQLWIEFDGMHYSTVAELGIRAATNPAIINR